MARFIEIILIDPTKEADGAHLMKIINADLIAEIGIGENYETTIVMRDGFKYEVVDLYMELFDLLNVQRPQAE
jgi:hypothetical protein